MLDRLQLVRQPFQNWHQVTIYEDHRIFRVIDDIHQLFREQANVQCVQDSAKTGYREIQLQVTIGVPPEGGDTVSLLHASAIQCIGKLQGAFPPLLEGIAMQSAIRLRHDFFFGEEANSTIERVL